MIEQCWFDERAALAAERFFERVIRHTKGQWAGQPFALQPWQRDKIIRPLFGWKRRDGSRRYRRAYIEIPRKQGKSTISSGVALLLLLADAEPGAEIYSAAADRAQAAIVFEQAKQFVEGSPLLSRELRVYRNHISAPKTNSVYKVLSADAFTKHGLNAHGIVFDELHAQPNRELWDVLATSMGARRQPLMVAITTAGYDRNSICWEQHEHARRVIDDPAFDPEYFGFIAAAEEGDDWTSPATWRKANPSLGVTVTEEYLAGECARALASPAYQNTFRRLYLNQWCVIMGTMIAMADGTQKRVEDLMTGEMIVSFDETTGELVHRRVRAVFDNGIHQTYRISTKRGRIVEATGNHPFWCRYGRTDSPKYGWVDACEIKEGDRVGVALGWPDCDNLSGLTVRQAQMLGIMIGDGAMTDSSPRITTIDNGILEFCQSMAPEFGVKLRPRGDHPAQWRFHKIVRGGRKKNGFKAWLEEQGVYWKNTYNKRVPESVWRGGASIWAAFMGGYLDTDGGVFEAKGNPSVIWVSANRELLSDSQQLLAMLGIQSNLKQGRKGQFVTWRLEVHERRSIALCADLLPLVHSEKAEKLRKADTTYNRHGIASLDRFRFDPVVSVEAMTPKTTIGVEIEGTHTHITNGLITHNTQQENRWIDMAAWDACGGALPVLDGRACYGGLDLASTTDIAALVLAFPPQEEGEPVWLLPHFWIPAEAMVERERRDRVPYSTWVRQGLVTATPGNVIDYGYIRNQINALAKRYDVREIAYDPWNATQLSVELQGDGVLMVEMRQGFASLSAPSKELLRLVLSQGVAHGANPVLRWMADNVSARQDPAGNVKPDKAKSTGRIDGIVASVMAIGRAAAADPAGGRSAYEDRGILVL